MTIGLAKIIILVVAVLAAIMLAFIVFESNKKSAQNKFFFLMSISIIGWLLFSYLAGTDPLLSRAIFWSRLNFGVVSLALTFAYFFVINFPVKKPVGKFIDYIACALGGTSLIAVLFTNKVIESAKKASWGNEIIYGPLWLDYLILSFLLASLIIYLLIKKYWTLTIREKARVKYFLIGTIIYFLSNVVFNVLVNLVTDSNKFDLFGDFSAIFFLGFTAYAIVKHQLFNIKVIATEVTVILLSIGLLIEVLISNSIAEGILKGTIWLLATYGGYVLIRSVKKEIQQREELAKLAEKLDKANQDLEELDEAKDNFLSMAAHELNTPIAAIEGYLSMIIDEKMAGKIPAKAEEYLSLVYNSSKRLAALVKDLLNVSRIESGRIHLIYEEAQIEDVIDQAIKEVKIKADEVGHKLTFERSGKVPKTWFDIARITEVIINMLGNSIKYTDPPGNISVIAHTDGDKLVVAIEDNGRGIPKDKSDHVFEKFTQVDVLKDQVKGTGLGMFITKNLIELHKGKVWFKSSTDEKDHGTTFFFSLPILKQKPFDPHEGEGALFQTKPAAKSSAPQGPSPAEPATSNDPSRSSQPLQPQASPEAEKAVSLSTEKKTEAQSTKKTEDSKLERNLAPDQKVAK